MQAGPASDGIVRHGDEPPVIEFERVTKRFGAVTAARDVSFSIGRGEMVALVGENGAGKSTIVNLVSGLLRPDAGMMRLDGEPVDLASPMRAAARGIGVVHQHYTLTPTLTALENIVLSLPELGLGIYDRKSVTARVARIADDLGFTVDLTARIDRLDVAHQQRIEIVKALLRDVRLLLLDEPTAVLGPRDQRQFFEMMRLLGERGVAVILVTHKMNDVFDVCQRALVMRGGVLVADRTTSTLDRETLVELMMGERKPAAGPIAEVTTPRHAAAEGEIVARIDGLALRRKDGSTAVEGVTMSLRAGEILAVAGVDGNGQAELVECLAGLAPPDGGTVEMLGVSSAEGKWTARHLRDRGLAHVPADRRRRGILNGRDLTDNFLLGRMHDRGLVPRGFIRRGDVRRVVAGVIGEFDIVSAGPGARIGALSGGNQQKLVLGRELSGKPRVLLAAYPSRGLDVRTTRFLHARLKAQCLAGAAVLLVSGDLDEIWLLADRIMVMSGGRAFGPVSRADATEAQIGAWIAGHGETSAKAS